MGIIQTGEYTAQNELRFVKGIGSHVRDSPTTRVTKMHAIYCGLIRGFMLYVALITLSIVVGITLFLFSASRTLTAFPQIPCRKPLF